MSKLDRILAVAPMMDWTDRHCRFFHRGLTRRALLYTEMVTAEAVIRGDRERLIGFRDEEHPVALQLGGSEPARLGEAARIGAEFGYDEINLNVGCPSDRVQSGAFGACLMREPELVGACIAAMQAAVDVPVTVKCRIGVDDQDPEEALDRLADCVIGAGASAIWVHARKAWLSGLSPKENRDVPPLDYARVYRLKQRLPGTFIGINGGVRSFGEVAAHLEHVDGVMLGRAACQHPAILAGADSLMGGPEAQVDLRAVAERMIPYAEAHCAAGGRLSAVTRPMVGLFQGVAGARLWRQILTVESARPGARPEVIGRALAEVTQSGRMDRRSFQRSLDAKDRAEPQVPGKSSTPPGKSQWLEKGCDTSHFDLARGAFSPRNGSHDDVEGSADARAVH
jgi:tRNA-dihydrouridine synthase A